MTGAEMWAIAGDASVLEDRGFSDPHFCGWRWFKSISADTIIADGDSVELDETRLRSQGYSVGSTACAASTRRETIAGLVPSSSLRGFLPLWSISRRYTCREDIPNATHHGAVLRR